MRAETQAPGERQQRDEEEDVRRRRRRSTGKGEEEEAANCWALVAQQSMSAGNVHHSAARAPSLLFSQAARSLASAQGRDKGLQLQCGRKPSRGSRKNWAKLVKIKLLPSSSTDSSCLQTPPGLNKALSPFGPARREDGLLSLGFQTELLVRMNAMRPTPARLVSQGAANYQKTPGAQSGTSP